MKLSNRLGIIFPQMSENKPRYEYESWLLPFKPIDIDVATSSVFKKPDSNSFEVNKATKKQDEQRDSKNRRILSREALLEDKNEHNPDNIPGLNNTSSCSGGPGVSSTLASSSKVSGSIPDSTNIPGPSNNPDPKLYPGLSSSHYPNFSPTSDTSPVPKEKGRERLQKVKMNPLQRKLEKALATPVTMSKAESMMLKMGWSGGALGKTGGGIIEPVVPNLAYATSTKGFGQEPPSPKPTKKPSKSKQSKNKADKAEKQLLKLEKRQQRLRVKMVFKENVMRYILDFVTNEREIAILFDRSLHNGQRKVIHRIVQEIRELGEMDVKSKIMNASNERLLLLNIASKNRYVLQTQSEGNPPLRYLCLFKEAPESMYLVTHYKLNDKENDFVKRDEEFQYIQYRFKSKKQKKAERLLAKNARQLIDNNRSINKGTKDKIVEESFDTSTIPEIAKDNKNEIDCEIENENESETVKTDEFNESDDDIIEADDDVMERINEDDKKTADIDEEIKEIVERTAAGACRITKNDEVLEMDKTEQGNENSRSENVNLNTNEAVVKEDVKSKENIHHKDNKDKDGEMKPKTDCNEETPIKISISTSSRKEFMRYNLNMCFSDFITGIAYKEFKFLGEFDEEEFEVLNEFLRDFFLVKDDKPAVDEEFMGVWKQAKCKLRFKRDLNGGIV